MKRRSGRGTAVVDAPPPELASAIDRDRRAIVERAVELGRWGVLVVAAVLINFPGAHIPFLTQANLLLAAWGGFNLIVMVSLLTGHVPGRRMAVPTLLMDMLVAAELVYLTGGIHSDLGIAVFVVVVAGSLRLGPWGGLLSTALLSALYGVAISAATGGLTSDVLTTLLSHILLFVVVAMGSGLLARELVAGRARQLEQTFELTHTASTQMLEVDRVKSDFMMLASHELRTPLTKIKTWLSLMQEHGDVMTGEMRGEGLGELRVETEHLTRLTDNLLAIAQLEAGEMRLNILSVQVEHAFRDVVARFVESVDHDRFISTVASDAQRVVADHDRLVLVLACLVDNALRFSPETEPVHLSAQRLNDRVHLEVHDNGRRIPDSQVERIFAAFYQVESPLVRQRDGFGVGLYLARQLVQRMGGNIWIDNTRARGNTFVVALPAPF